MKTRKSFLRRLRAAWYLCSPSEEDLLAGAATLVLMILFTAIVEALA